MLWDPRHGSPGSRHKTYVQVLLEDTGLEKISETDFSNGGPQSKEVYCCLQVEHDDDDGRLRSK